MNLQLYYLTGTGNSLSLTWELAWQFAHADIYATPELQQKGEPVRIEGDVVGFVFPVYFARTPVVVQKFIQEARFGSISYVFAIMNGGGLFGTVLPVTIIARTRPYAWRTKTRLSGICVRICCHKGM